MAGFSIQHVSGNILSSLVGSFDVYDFIFWGMRQSIYFLIFIAESCQCIFYLLNGDHLNKKSVITIENESILINHQLITDRTNRSLTDH